MKKIQFYSLLIILTTVLSGCWSGTTEYEGISFPKTTATQVSFQKQTIPGDCSAFAHLQMNTKMHSSGKDIEEAMLKEAGDKGANLVLVGMSRENMGAELEENHFSYFGPEYAYTFNKTWLGWKFGFDEWNDCDKLVGLGADNWGSSDVSFDNSLLIQAVFLRCGE
ncbi:MAG: hypothetical protein K9K37_13370 [Desulfocapsa sp.]|nr:hypothetical protein [Desulfocapsa sp.]